MIQEQTRRKGDKDEDTSEIKRSDSFTSKGQLKPDEFVKRSERACRGLEGWKETESPKRNENSNKDSSWTKGPTHRWGHHKNLGGDKIKSPYVSPNGGGPCE